MDKNKRKCKILLIQKDKLKGDKNANENKASHTPSNR